MKTSLFICLAAVGGGCAPVSKVDRSKDLGQSGSASEKRDDHFPGVGRIEDLGAGYDAAHISEISNSSFDGIGHFLYLRKDGRKISRTGAHGVSNDEKYIAYQNAADARVFLLVKSSGVTTTLTEESPGTVRDFDWEREAGSLWIDFYSRKPLRIALPGDTHSHS